MDTAAHERQGQALHGLVSPRRVFTPLFAATVLACLLAGIAGGGAKKSSAGRGPAGTGMFSAAPPTGAAGGRLVAAVISAVTSSALC